MARKRPRLFAFSRDVELGWYADSIAASSRPAIEAVVDAFIAIAGDRALTPERLAPITAGAAHPDSMVRGVAITRLAVLLHYFPEVTTAFAELFANVDASVRAFACAGLVNAPPDLAGPLIASALLDPDWSVRKAAAQVAAAVPLPELSPEISARVQDERDARVRVVLKLAEVFQQRHAT